MVSVHTSIVTAAYLFSIAAASAQTTASLGAAQPFPSHPVQLSSEERADILMARKMYREAIDYYQQAPPNSAVTWNKMGIAYHQLLDTSAARKDYERAIRLDPNYAEAVNNLGTIYYSEKNYRRAVKLYKRALKLSPKFASVYSNLGTAYFERRDYKKASDAYQTALQLDPEVFEHRSTYGTILQERNITERAKFHYYLARTYAKAGMNDRALLYLRKAFEEGLAERQKLMQAPEFSTIRGMEEFKQIMASEPRVL